MEVIKFLEQLEKIKHQIEVKQQLLETYRSIAEGRQSPTYSDIPKSVRKPSSPMANAILKIVALEDEIKQLQNQYHICEDEILHVIQQLSDEILQIILIEKYINGLSWFAIGRKIGYARTRIYELKGEALCRLEDIFEKKRT